MIKADGKVRIWLLLIGTVFAFSVAVGLCADRRIESVPSTPKVAAITQITHDGVSKTNLLSDGANLYVTEAPAAFHEVAKVSLQTTDRALLSTAFSNWQALDISPDHKKLLVLAIQGNSGSNEFWALPMGAGTPERLAEVSGRDATWSPDGLQLAFANKSTLFIANANGSSAREVFTANGSVFAPRISVDGKRIRFTVGNAAENTTSIWEVEADGSNPHAVLGNWHYASSACCGNWTRDGRYYIFQVTQTIPTALTTLWALADAGLNNAASPIQLTSGPTSFGNVSPSADNKKIWAIGVQPLAEPVKYSPKGNDFAPLLAGVSATDLDFSPDAQWVAYISVPDGELWRCRADGSQKLKLTSAPERVALPRWSPDGRHIAYVRIVHGEPSKISVVSISGGASQDVLIESRSQIDANWSSDGGQIMLGSFVQDKDINIRLINLKTHKVETIPGSDGLFSPRWSPNGRYVAALSPDFTKVMLFDFQTQKWTTWLTEPAGAVSYPVWSNDSNYLYFDDLVTGEETIRKVKVSESRAERVFKLKGIERYAGPFGIWSGRTPDGSWMFVRDRSTQEVYQLSVELP